MGRLVKFLLLLFTLSLISCGDSNLLMTLSDSENAVTFRTSINSGDILNPESGETIDISMDYDESIVRPVRLEIAFLDFQGLEISEPEIIEGDITSRKSIIESLKETKAIIISISAMHRKLIRKTKLI